MLRHVTLGLIGLAASLASPVLASVIITLEPVSAEMNPTTGSVPTATQVTVNILLSADGVDSPLLDVRQMRFDFSKTSSTLKLGEFRWTFDSLDNAGLHLTAEDRRALKWEAIYGMLGGAGGAVVSLDETPVRVATVEVTVNGTGTLDAVGLAAPPRGDGAFFWVGFRDPVEFSLPKDNVSGGTVTLRAVDAPPPGQRAHDHPADGDEPADEPGQPVDGGDDGVGDEPGADDEADPDDEAEPDGDDTGEDEPPPEPEESVDTDGDGDNDDVDTDDDGDGVPDDEDAFPLDPDESVDADGDGVGNEADKDDDNDGVLDDKDAFPEDPLETADSDGDEVGDNADDFPEDPGETTDSDGDGTGDNADPDDDNDGVPDSDDEEPLDPTLPVREATSNRGPRVSGGMCGLGMIGSVLVIMCGIAGMRGRRRGCRRPGR